jgi:magnesium transporter
MKETMSLIDRIGKEVEKIKEDLFDKKPGGIIESISVTRKNIILLDTIFKPQLRLFNRFESGDIRGFADDMEEYWGNILDYYQKMWDMTEDYKELIEGLSKTYDSLQTNRINEIIKVLTLISTILLPITFVASLYGMNVGLPFQARSEAFWIVMGSMILVVGGFLLYFKRKKWM